MTVTGLDHVQLACPAGAEDMLRAFYGGLLGMAEIPKPPLLADPVGNRVEIVAAAGLSGTRAAGGR